ncbi:hypothetical protein BU25DRAFT_407463 [Macroventuria anomochaeta]|uniref:Uncharacterized protein n=1 Tax=Macroventuria anomochaeta TaxID=301207 RepID=A0ACB6SCF0_9PLEO|nr:uncharacterized protein BU25DRAFT_407463 [Macroventuria anomochaeta]KAF2631826.1 hypothetical protein BU25DRAFT_407463 [Macroventuria anomochaeta]
MAPHPELEADTQAQALSPLATRALHLAQSLAKRDEYNNLAAAGARPAQDLAGPGFQVLFALIGVGMTLTAIWFFMWAKNGGFKWKKDDWEDYKSTVLRRKGPDGRTLSNATKSTRLGGGSVVHGGSYGAPTSVGYTDETATSADMSEIRDAEEGKSRHGLRGGDGRRHKKHRRDHTNDYNDPDLDGYRHEKAARVGGLNRQADGMYTDYSPTEPSDLGSNVSGKPLVKKDKRDPKKEAKEKERRARERMKNAKAAEKEALKTAAAQAKARKEAEKAEAKREKAEQKKAKKAGSEVGSEMPEMVETRTEYTRTFTEYTAPSEYDRSETRDFAPPPPKSPVKSPAKSPVKSSSPAKAPSNARRAPPSAAYSFTTGDDDANTVYTGAYTEATDDRTAAESSYYSDYRPKAERSQARQQSRDRTSQSRPRPQGSRSRPTSQSPQKKHRSSRTANSYAPSDIFTTANGGTQGHMSYPCHIPGLSQAGSVGVSESVSQVGGPSSHRRERERGSRDVMAGYRRGGERGRRDSLSDSDS